MRKSRSMSAGYTCRVPAQKVSSVRMAVFEHGFTVMMDFSPYFKDVVESS